MRTSWIKARAIIGGTMALAIPAGAQQGPLVTDTDEVNREKYFPVSLKCPAENSGTLELVSKNAEGWWQRIRVTYKNDRPIIAELQVASPSTAFLDVKKINLITENDPIQIAAGEFLVKKVATINKNVCLSREKGESR
jgi:hypothetical protein